MRRRRHGRCFYLWSESAGPLSLYVRVHRTCSALPSGWRAAESCCRLVRTWGSWQACPPRSQPCSPPAAAPGPRRSRRPPPAPGDPWPGPEVSPPPRACRPPRRAEPARSCGRQSRGRRAARQGGPARPPPPACPRGGTGRRTRAARRQTLTRRASLVPCTRPLAPPPPGGSAAAVREGLPASGGVPRGVHSSSTPRQGKGTAFRGGERVGAGWRPAPAPGTCPRPCSTAGRAPPPSTPAPGRQRRSSSNGVQQCTERAAASRARLPPAPRGAHRAVRRWAGGASGRQPAAAAGGAAARGGCSRRRACCRRWGRSPAAGPRPSWAAACCWSTAPRVRRACAVLCFAARSAWRRTRCRAAGAAHKCACSAQAKAFRVQLTNGQRRQGEACTTKRSKEKQQTPPQALRGAVFVDAAGLVVDGSVSALSLRDLDGGPLLGVLCPASQQLVLLPLLGG